MYFLLRTEKAENIQRMSKEVGVGDMITKRKGNGTTDSGQDHLLHIYT